MNYIVYYTLYYIGVIVVVTNSCVEYFIVQISDKFYFASVKR